MNNYWKELYYAFRRVHGYLIAIVGIAMSLVSFYFVTSDTVLVKHLIPFAIMVLIIVFTLLDLSYNLYVERTKVLPKVRQAKSPQSINKPAIAWLLLDQSPVFGHESLISVFYEDGDFEVLVGSGFIQTVQENGLVQVLVTDNFNDTDPEFWEKVCGNDQNIQKKK